MIRLYIEPDAEEELEEAAGRYEDALPGLGQQFVTEMRQRVSGHRLGSMLGLGVSKDESNLMALGTTGTELQPQQVRSLQIPTEFIQPDVAFLHERDSVNVRVRPPRRV
jgi:hypothetical protein